ncbi:MAG: exosortase/archaeosortase family protein [Pedobacter sp.]|nr:MAG: exosortase/archaeosortase family protein [Pedobacter sp.]
MKLMPAHGTAAVFGLFRACSRLDLPPQASGNSQALISRPDQILRSVYITSTAFILEIMDYKVVVSSYGLKVQNHAGFRLVYSCLGYGICSCFSAFALSVPDPFRYRYIFLFIGISSIFILNISRLVIVAIYYHAKFNIMGLDHHDIFNIITYAMIMLCSYLYLNYVKYAK